MKRVITPLIPKEFLDTKMQHFEIEYILYLPNKLKRDISNVLSIVDKYVCDALVEAGVLEDDNYNHLKKVVYKYGGMDSNRKGYVIMKVKEKEDAD